jgi:integrase
VVGAIRRRPSGKWQARWREPGGYQVRGRTFARRRDAEAFLATIEADKLRGVYQDPSLGKITLRAFWPTFLESSPHLRPATVDLYTRLADRHVLPELGGRPLASITRLDVEAWIAGRLAAGAGPGAVNAAFRLLRRILSTAEASGRIARNPARGVKAPQLSKGPMRFLSIDELAAVVEASPHRDHALVRLLGLCGPRVGEALALHVEDLVLEHPASVRITKSLVEVRGQLSIGPTKTGARRAVPLPRFVARELERHLQEFPPGPGGLVFTGPEGGAIRRTNWRRRVWIPALRAAGIAPPLPRIHDLRHTAAALAIQAGGHPKAIQEMLGHSSITVTLDRYGHLFPSLAEDLAARLDQVATAADGSRVARLWPAGAGRPA